VTLPARLGVAGSPGPLVTRGGVIFVTGGGNALWAIDAATGRELWSHDFGKQAYANPMTYRARDGRQYVVVATGAGGRGTAAEPSSACCRARSGSASSETLGGRP